MRELKDKRGRLIQENDIVSVFGHIGWIYKYNDQYHIAWDLEGPSCENSDPLDDYYTEEYGYNVKIVGKLL